MERQRHLPALLQKSFGTPGRFRRQVRENPWADVEGSFELLVERVEDLRKEPEIGSQSEDFQAWPGTPERLQPRKFLSSPLLPSWRSPNQNIPETQASP